MSKFNPKDWRFESTHETAVDPDLAEHIKTAPAPAVTYRSATMNDIYAECEHEFHEVKDYEGDPSLPGGMHEIRFYKCEHCGFEQDEKPEIVEEPFDDPYPEDSELVDDRDCDYWNRS